MLQTALYDPTGVLANKLNGLLVFDKLKDAAFIGSLTESKLEKAIINHKVDVVIAAAGALFSEIGFLEQVLTNYPHIFVVVIGLSDKYRDVRNAFVKGAYDYLVYDEKLDNSLRNTFSRMMKARRDAYFNEKIYDKMHMLARHIFDGGSHVELLVDDIVNTVYSDWEGNEIACQQVIERMKLESYKHFVRKKPWLEKFIYRGDYIRDIGFEVKGRIETEKELCVYYSDVDNLFKKYNVIDINKTVYTIGKSVIHQVDNKVTLESVAADVFLNKTYVSHIFKEMTGISFNDFVLEVKIDRAKMLLHYPDITVNYIAELLCFCNAGYFSLLFKKNTGLTPTEYRNMLKKIV